LKRGMGKSQDQEKLATNSGYWPTFRYNPLLIKEGKNPLTIDCKAPDGTIGEFIMSENRYAALDKMMPEVAAGLRADLEGDIMDRWNQLNLLASGAAGAPSASGGTAAKSGGKNGGDNCTLSATAEHTSGGGKACDDGRAGK